MVSRRPLPAPACCKPLFSKLSSAWGAARVAALGLLLGSAGCERELAQLPGSVDGSVEPEPAGTLSAVVNDQYLPALVSMLDGAREAVWVVHFEMNDDRDGDALEERLKSTAARGVTVNVLLEDSVSSNAARVTALTAAGVKARLDSSKRYTHAKLVVVDGKRALLGSTNWSVQSLENNNEADVLVEQPATAAWFARYAQALVAAPEQTPTLTPLTTALGTALKDGDYVGRAGALIDGAQRRIHLVTYGMNADPQYPDGDVLTLVRKLGAARKRGVEVQVVLEISTPDLGVNDLNRQAAQALLAQGVQVRFDPPGRITHAKVLLVDDEVIVGSNNWGYGGFRTYHEVGMHTRVPGVVAAMESYLAGLWASGTDAR